MLSIIALWSFVFLSPWLILSHYPSSEASLLARQLPRVRFTLRTWTVLIGILAIDFAINSCLRSFPGAFVRASICDAVIIVVPFLKTAKFRTTPAEVWAIGGVVGVLGILSFPAVTGH
jgi:hypothetical protein